MSKGNILLPEDLEEVPLKCMLYLLPEYFGPLVPETLRVEEKSPYWQKQLALIAVGHGATFIQ